MTVIRLQTLGEALIEIGDVRVAPAATRAFATMLYLCVERERRIPRASLQGILFPGSSEANASHSLRQLLYKLRQMRVPVEVEGETVGLSSSRVSDDFSGLLTVARFGSEDLAAIAGGFLPGYAPSFSEPFTEWLDAFRGRVTLQLRRVLVEQLSQLRRRGDWREVERAARACLALDALNEEGTLALAEALAMSGSKVEAVRLLDTFAREMSSIDPRLVTRAARTKTRISERIESDNYVGRRRLCGRSHELSAVTNRLEMVRRGRAQCVALVGPEGIGKTRLVRAFAERMALEELAFVQWSCRSSGPSRPLGVFAGCVPEMLRLPGALGCSPESLQLLSRLTQHDLGVALLSREAHAAELLFSQITFAFGDLAEAITSEQPLILVIDDADYADSHSLKALSEISRRHDSRVMIVLTAQDLNSCAVLWEQQPPHDRLLLNISGLSEPDVIELVRSAIPDIELIPGSIAASRLLVLTGGNPLSVLAFANQRLLTWEGSSSSQAIDYVLDRRLDGVSSESRRLLEGCVILRERASISRIASLTGLSATELVSATRELDRALMIQCEPEYLMCSHELVSQAVARNMSEATSRALHFGAAILAEAELRGSSSAALLWTCAEHWEAAADSERANYFARRCARHSIELGQPADAVRILRRVLSRTSVTSQLKATLEEAIEAAELAADWHAVASFAAWLRSETSQSGTNGTAHSQLELLELQAKWRSGASLVDQLPKLVECSTCSNADPLHRALASSLLLVVADLTFDPELAEVAYQQIASEHDQGYVRAEEFSKCKLVYNVAFGDPLSAMQEARSIVSSSSGVKLTSARCNHLYNAGMAFMRLGNLGEATAAFSVCYDLANGSHLHTYQVLAAAGNSSIYRFFGDTELSGEWHGRASMIFDRFEVKGAAPHHYSNCLERAIDSGDQEDASKWLARSQLEYSAVTSGRPRLTFLAYTALVTPPSRSQQRADLLAELLIGHRAARAFGLHDIVVLAIARLLEAESRVTEALHLVEQYVTRYRRDGFPMHPELRRRLSKGLWSPTIAVVSASKPELAAY